MTSRPDLEVTPATADWDFPRSVSGVVLLVEFAGRYGFPTTEVLRGTGIGSRDLTDPDLLVPATAELRALRNLRARWDSGRTREPLGLVLGRSYHITSFGILGYALMSSPTLAEAVNLTLRFLDLTHVFSTPHIHLPGTGRAAVGEIEVELRVAGLEEDPDLAAFLRERDLCAIVQVLHELAGGRFELTAVDLPVGPGTEDGYRALLGVVPRPQGQRAAFRFRFAELERPLPQGNPHSQSLAEALCRDVVSRRRRRTGITEQVRVWITRNVAHGADMAQAAESLALSERTLRRRLSQEGTGYQALLDEVREALAEEMLGTGLLSVEDIALRLGYAEASSFIHAFKRWKGCTPARFVPPSPY